VEEVFQRQQRERAKLREEYQKQMMSVLTQMESDIDKTKDAEDKLEVVERHVSLSWIAVLKRMHVCLYTDLLYCHRDASLNTISIHWITVFNVLAGCMSTHWAIVLE
jgi:hypothetical protein